MRNFKLLAAVFSLFTVITLNAGNIPGVLYEQWRGLKGDSVQSLTDSAKYKKLANLALIIKNFQRYNSGENFGARFTSILTPPKSNDYTFYISSDDSSELWLSRDDSPDNLQKIASVSGYTASKVWNRFPSQSSNAVKLEGGKNYYMMVLQKQGGGVSHVEVAWERPGFKREMVPVEYLSVPPMTPEIAQFAKEGIMLLADSSKALAKLQDLPKGEFLTFTAGIPAKQKNVIIETLAKFAKKLKNNPTDRNMALAKKYYEQALSITPSRKEPVTDPLYIQLLYIEGIYLKNLSVEELNQIGAHRTAAVMGNIPNDAQITDGVVKLSSRPSKGRSYELLSTGFYALPGKEGQLTIPGDFVGKKLQLQLGHHLDAPQSRVKSFYSMPETTITKNITSIDTDFITPYGGLIFIKVPKGVSFKEKIFKIKGALKAPRFVLGETTDEEWTQIRNFPAPWGELIADRIIFTAPSDILKKVDNPTDLMRWWNTNITRHEEFYGYNINLPLRMHVSYYPIRGCSTWPLYETPETMLQNFNLKSLKAFNQALFLHEHGHHADDSRMMFQSIGESTPNWAGYYIKGVYGDFAWKDAEETHMMRLFDPNDEMHNNIKEDQWWKKKWTHYWSYPITSIMLGYVQGFGWSAFKKCVHRFTYPGDPVNKLSFCNTNGVAYGKKDNVDAANQAVIDKWLIFMSEEAQKDITPYMAHFYLKPSPECRIYLDRRKYKKWDLIYIPERIIVTSVNKPVRVTSPAKYALTMLKNLKFAWKGKPEHGTLSDDFLYKPSKGFKGNDKIAFSITDRYGNVQNGEIHIKVVPSKKFLQFSGAVLASVSTGKWSHIKFSTKFRNPLVLTSIVKPEGKKLATSFIPRIRNLSPDGCEITIVPKSEGQGAVQALPVALCIMDTGEFTIEENGIRGDVGIMDIVPEPLSGHISYETKLLDGNWPALRDSSFGQVLSSNNQQWSEFFTGSLFDVRGKIIGAYGNAEKFTRKEKVGYAFLKYGFYQFGDKSVKITADSISVGNAVLRMDIPDVKRLEHKFRRK
jgi:hypothetical protein